MTGITQGWRVTTELPSVPWLPAAATTMTPFWAARSDRVAKGTLLQIARDDGNYAGMARDHGTSQRSLVAGGGHHDDALLGRTIQGIAHLELIVRRRPRHRGAHVDHAGTGIDTIVDGCGECGGRCRRHP